MKSFLKSKSSPLSRDLRQKLKSQLERRLPRRPQQLRKVPKKGKAPAKGAPVTDPADDAQTV